MNNKIHHNSYFHTAAICYGWVFWWSSTLESIKERDVRKKEERKKRNLEVKKAKERDCFLRQTIREIKENEKNGHEDVINREYLSLHGIWLSTEYQPLYITVESNEEWVAEDAFYFPSLYNVSETVEISVLSIVIKKLVDSIEVFKLESVLRIKVKRLLLKLTPPSYWDKYIQFTRTLTSANSELRLCISEGFSLSIFSRPPPFHQIFL